MATGPLEVLIYRKGIGSHEFSLQKAQGVELLAVERFANPNYALLRLGIAPDAEAQEFEIKSKGRGKAFSYRYRLKEKKHAASGLDQADLIYLITPDRFANGDPSNDDVPGMQERGIDRSEPYARHGGDIQGMIDQLDYIQKLGVTAIWPNPLYENDQPRESYHGYAFTNHFRIDPRFGSNALFGALCDSLRSRDMKMVMDVVYNHIGDRHPLYSDMPDSSWFHLHPEFLKTNYRATALMDPYASAYDKHKMSNGWFDSHMPDLDQRNPKVARYLVQQTLWWIEEYGIDALRIDTYAYPDQDFMRSWAKDIKAEYPGIFIFAETWVHGSPVQAYFLGDALGPEPNHIDGLTDFQVHYAINDALTRDAGWTEGINRLYYTLAADYIYAQPEKLVTFLDNHDVARFFGYVNRDMRKFKMGIAMLFTLRGIPSLYYGTELLMAQTDGHGKIREDVMGGWPGDPQNKFSREGRSEEENEAYDFIAAMAALRQKHAALQDGHTVQFVPEQGFYAYFRSSETETFLIAMNASNEQQSRALETYRELAPEGSALMLINGNANVEFGELHIPAYGFGIFQVVK